MCVRGVCAWCVLCVCVCACVCVCEGGDVCGLVIKALNCGLKDLLFQSHLQLLLLHHPEVNLSEYLHDYIKVHM